MRIGAIYLAAGFSKRMGEAKLSLELAPGVTVGSQGLLALRRSGFQPIVVVVRPQDPLLWLLDKTGGSGHLPKYRISPCMEAHEGISRSIKHGMQALLPEEPDAVMIALADQPFISEKLLQRLIAVYREDPTVDYVASGYGDIAAPPVLFGKSVFPSLCRLEGDAGARGILQSPAYRGRIVRYAAEWSLVDVDTRAQLNRARELWSRAQVRAR